MKSAAAIALIVASMSWTSAELTAQHQAASQPKQAAARVRPTEAKTPALRRVLPGTPATAFGTIRGSAVTATNEPIAAGTVRLRDIRFGGIAGTGATDRAGLFVFEHVDPGTYIVELVDRNQAVLATSDALNLDAADTVSSIVRLPLRVPPALGFLGRGTSEALAVITAAAASGVLASDVTGEDVSPR